MPTKILETPLILYQTDFNIFIYYTSNPPTIKSKQSLPRQVFEKKVRFLFEGWLVDLVMVQYLIPLGFIPILLFSNPDFNFH